MEANTQLECRYKTLLKVGNQNHSLTGTVLYTQDTNVISVAISDVLSYSEQSTSVATVVQNDKCLGRVLQ
jgi:hypothetical protein